MKQFKRLQSGQGVTEYALMIAAVAIVALAVITVFADPQDWRNGVIYQGIYRPVQCIVQGISQDNCTERGGEFSALRYPSVTNGNSRKQCNSWASDNDATTGGNDDFYSPVVPDDGSVDAWAACAQPSDNSEDGPGGTWVAIDFIQYREAGTDTWITLVEGQDLVRGSYDFRAFWKRYVPDDPDTDGTDEEEPYVEPEVVEIQLTDPSSTTTTVVRDMQSGTNNEVDRFNSRDNEFRYATDLEETPEQFALLDTNGTYSIRAEAFDVEGFSQTVTPQNNGDPIPVYNFNMVDPAPPIITNIVLRDTDPASETPTRTFDRTQSDYTIDKALYTVQFNTNQNQDGDELAYTLTYVTGGTVIDSGTLTFPDDHPYLLYDPAGFDFAAGDYELDVIVQNAAGVTDDNADDSVLDGTLTVEFTIDAPPPTLLVTGFALVDADNETEIAAVNDGDVLTLDGTDGTGDLVSFVANVADPEGVVQSVILRLVDSGDNVIENSGPENAPPYSLFGDSGGDFDGEYLAPGEYTLSAVPYNEDNASGISGDEVSITFTVEEPAVEEGPFARFFVQNTSQSSDYNYTVELAALNTKTGTTNPGTTEIDLGEVNYNWNIAVETCNLFDECTDDGSGRYNVNRVRFSGTASNGGSLPFSSDTESYEPYHIDGDNNSLNLQPGDYNLEVEVTDDASGESVTTTYELSFSVVQPDACQLEIKDLNCGGGYIGLQFQTARGQCTNEDFANSSFGAGKTDWPVDTIDANGWETSCSGGDCRQVYRFELRPQSGQNLSGVCDGSFNDGGIPVVIATSGGDTYDYLYEFVSGGDGNLSLP